MKDYGMFTEEGNRRVGEIVDGLVPAQGERFREAGFAGVVARAEVEADAASSDRLLVVVLEGGARVFLDLLELAKERLEALAFDSAYAEAEDDQVLGPVYTEIRRRWS